MITLSYGYKKPQTGDRGSIWFPAMEDNIQRLNDHTHDGSNSSLIAPAAITKYYQTLLAAGWVSDGGGNYSRSVTVPAGINEVNSYFAKFYNLANGHQMHLTWERLTPLTYTLKINDNTLDVVAVYV